MCKEKLIVNSDKGNLLTELISNLETCERFYFSVAFVNYSGLQLLLDALNETHRKEIKGSIITSTYLNFTEPKALKKINEFENIDLKVFLTDQQNVGFHTKAYIFEYTDYYKIIIGSSNITQNALKSNVEWNVEVVSKENTPFIKKVLKEYNDLWDRSSYADEHLISQYQSLINQIESFTTTHQFVYEKPEYIIPNSMQKRAMTNLIRIRSLGENKALVIAATGTGKTYMSAFDVKQVKPKRLLFVVHREEILVKAKETFERLLPNEGLTFGLLTGSQKNPHSDYVFATIQTLSNSLELFNKNDFDYIIFDEAHHATAHSYQGTLEYFTPTFTLGMTATPERSDGHSVFDLFDNNVALEVRLHEALEENIVIPFHYFGITDIDGIDLEEVDIDNMAEVAKRLKVNERVDYIISKLEFYGNDGSKRKCIGFCASKDHAEYMANEFNKRGYKSINLDGSHSVETRAKYIRLLEDPHSDLEFIFTVDIFNEGVDIPSVNLVLMLRPTNSPIIFIQQLGRGLRKHKDKEFLTVLDFIGNHNKAYLVAIALNGRKYYDKESLKVAVATGFANIPGATHIQMDKVSQERILAQIDQENFLSMKHLKEEYKAFKQMKQGEIPYYMMDYLTYDGSPDPTKFIKRNNGSSYLRFVANVEKDKYLNELLESNLFSDTLESLSKMLPLKRVNEFVILRYLINHSTVTVDQAKLEIEKITEHVDRDSVLHAMEYLDHQYYDTEQKKSNPKLVTMNTEILTRTETFEFIIQNGEQKSFIKDVLDYGIHRYERDFKHYDYGIPHLKLYEEYQAFDIALLSNYRKSQRAFRGSGLLSNGNDYFLFIDLHKEKDIEERVNYQDKFINQSVLQWETPNSTRQTSDRGQNLIHNHSREIKLHVFIRKYREISPGKAAPFIYLGKANTIGYTGEKPIKMKLELENEVPTHLYTEFTEIV